MTTVKSPSAFVVSITPFDESGALDEAGLRGHLRRMADADIGVYVGGGGSGEGFTLSPDERRLLAEVAVDEVGGRVPVRWMGIEPRTAAEMVGHVAMASAAGVDAAQIYAVDVGHGHRPSQAAVEAYFTEVLDRTDVPVVLSTHPSVGYRIPVTRLERLVARFDNVVGVVCSHPDLRYLADLVDAVGDRVEVHVGGPNNALAAFALGAHGFLCSEANLAPHLAMSVIERWHADDMTGLLREFGRLVRLSGLLYGSGGILATKAVLARFGQPGGLPRKPHLPVTDDVTAWLVAEVQELGVPGIERWNNT